VQVVVDAPVWVDYFTGAATPETDRLDALLGTSPIVVPDVVLARVLEALPDEAHRRQAEGALLKLWVIEVGGLALHRRSVVHFHTLRARGIPVEPAECLLATFCIDSRFALLSSSPGFEPFERHLGLAVARGASPEPPS
jgi:predicted nucleic acid-binding protein